jgi:membrane protease YdiL (CAAX protease family)
VNEPRQVPTLGPEANDGEAIPARETLAALGLGVAALLIGGAVPGALLYSHLAAPTSIPWFLPATLLWLGLFWSYARGRGWPRRTSALRRDLAPAEPLSLRAWIETLVAGGLALTAVMGLAFVTYRHAPLPPAAYRGAFEVSALPGWSTASVFVALAVTAGVVEEVAFRGYLLSAFQRRWGWSVGIAAVSLLFYLSHLGHAYATLAFLPFFLAHGLVFGLLVRATGSIVPGVVLHALSDLVVLPMQYGALPSAGRWDLVGDGWLSLIAGAAAVVGFRRLERLRLRRASAAAG